METAVIRPGILVALHTSVSGGVTYTRTDLDSGKTEAELQAEAESAGTPVRSVARWETTRTIDNPAEHAAACKARNAAQSLIRGVCARTSFGLLCPAGDEPRLDAAVAKARTLVDEYNEGAAGTRVTVYVLKGRIAGTDEEAARAIVSEVQGLIDDMGRGIDALDPEAIREAARKAQDLGGMLGPEKAEAITGAVEAARKAARQIVAKYEKGGEQAAVVLADIQRGALEKARIAFLDLGAAVLPVGDDATPAADLNRAAQLELDTLPAPAADDDEPASTPSVEIDTGAPELATLAAQGVA